MIQKSEFESDLILHGPLRVLLYKEGLSQYHDRAGSIPSDVNSSLKDTIGVIMRKQTSVEDGRIQWIELHEFKSTQGEV